MIDPSTLDFDKAGGLIPVVVQDAATLQVLTLVWLVGCAGWAIQVLWRL